MRTFLVVGLALLPMVLSDHGLGASPQDSVSQSEAAVQSSENPPAVGEKPATALTQGEVLPAATDATNAAAGDAVDPMPVAAAGREAEQGYAPVVLLVVGIVSVLGMIIGLKLNAFMALIISALIVSLGVGFVDGEDAGSRMAAVVQGFGGAAGGIGIVIAMAAIIGKCMLDSGAADPHVLHQPLYHHVLLRQAC